MAENEGFDLSRLGEWGDEVEFAVEAERTIAYAEATNDPIKQHLDGVYAPPVFAVVPAMTLMAEATLSVVPDELMLTILHGEHDFRFHRPIEPGETLTVRAKPVGIEGKSSGVVVTTAMETVSDRGDLVNEQYFIGFFRGGTFTGSEGIRAPEHGFDDSLRARRADTTAVQGFDIDQTFRYAEPAGDPMPIHLDDEFARQMGLPGIIIHGLCTMAFTSHAVIGHACPEDPARLRRLAVRFSSPARPGNTMTTGIWHRETRADRDVYVFESHADDGRALIKDGLAEISS